jgi:hypothetical protein
MRIISVPETIITETPEGTYTTTITTIRSKCCCCNCNRTIVSTTFTPAGGGGIPNSQTGNENSNVFWCVNFAGTPSCVEVPVGITPTGSISGPYATMEICNTFC